MKIKNLIIISLFIFILFGCKDTDTGSDDEEYTGANLIAVIKTGIEPYGNNSRTHFGMKYYDNSLYLTGFDTNEITRISLTDLQIESGYPASFNIPFGSGDFDINPADDSIWLCIGGAHDRLLHYSSGVNYLGELTGTDFYPTNLLIYDDNMYIANSYDNNIIVLNKDTHAYVTDFYLTGHESESVTDYCVYQNNLYFITNGNIVIKSNLTGTLQEPITIKGINDLYSLHGIAVYGQEMFFSCNNGLDNFVIVTDLSGQVLNRWELYRAYGWTGAFACIEVVDGNIYIANSNSQYFGIVIGYFLVYQQN